MQKSRVTKYTTAILDLLEHKGHVTNAEILEFLHREYPSLSATTVHRSTSRLSELKQISIAPSDLQGSMRFDYNLSPHDHFICTNCGGIRDIDIAKEFLPRISEALGGCKVTGRLVINGSCETCLEKLKEE